MSKNFKPILVVAGDPKSIFLEIYIKSLRLKKISNPLILIINEKILIDQMKILNQKFRLNKLKDTKTDLISQTSFINGFISSISTWSR